MIFAAFVTIAIIALVVNFLIEKRRAHEVTKHFVSPPRTILGFTKFSNQTFQEWFIKGQLDVHYMFHYVLSIPHKYALNTVVWGLFNHYEFLIARPEDVETIMTGKSTEKAQLYDFLKPWLGEGLLVSNGQKWFHRRKIITPTFHFKILEQFVEVFNEQDKKLVQKLKKYADNNEDCNIYQHLTAMALDIICESAMGVKINCQDDPNSEYIVAVKEMGDIIIGRVFSLLNQQPRLWELTSTARQSKSVIKKLHNFTNNVIKERRKLLNSKINNKTTKEEDDVGRKQRFSFLDMLLQATIDGEPLSHEDIREEVDTFMFEGHDTTTSGMTFSMYNLAMHPDIQEKAFDELRKVMGDDPNTPVTYDNLQEMKYLEKFIKENERLYPSVPVIGRKTIEPIQIDGVTVPAGVSLHILIYAMHRNPKVFPDPLKFDPERFDEEKDRTWGPFDYIPFSAGQRNCVGQKFAMLEMKTVVSTILRHYKVVASDKTRSMTYQGDLVLRPNHGLHIKLEKRQY